MKVCKFNSNRRCWHSSCSVFHCASGVVFCCPAHPNPSGCFTARRVVPVHSPIFSKHLKVDGRKGVVFIDDVGYECDSSVDMSGYIPLNERIHCACRCSICCRNLWIRSCYKRGDLLVQSEFVGGSLKGVTLG